jgi:hypothetical protein
MPPPHLHLDADTSLKALYATLDTVALDCGSRSCIVGNYGHRLAGAGTVAQSVAVVRPVQALWPLLM